jgi:hypothetical protein
VSGAEDVEDEGELVVILKTFEAVPRRQTPRPSTTFMPSRHPDPASTFAPCRSGKARISRPCPTGPTNSYALDDNAARL